MPGIEDDPSYRHIFIRHREMEARIAPYKGKLWVNDFGTKYILTGVNDLGYLYWSKPGRKKQVVMQYKVDDLEELLARNPGRKHLTGHVSAKAQRAYEHIKASLTGGRRKEIAARTVRKMIGEGKLNPDVAVGQFVKARFTVKGYTERMWVRVTAVHPIFISGVLDNEPATEPVASKYALGDKVRVLKRNILEVQNPGSRFSNPEVEEITEGFHGRPVEEEVEVEEEESYPEKVAVLGCLLDITVETKDGYEVPIIFLRDGEEPRKGEEVYLCAPDRHNLEFVGGDQEIANVEEITKHTDKRVVCLGKVKALAYRTDKHHLSDSNGEEVPYEHSFGRKRVFPFRGMKGCPELMYDVVDCHIFLAGGSYTVRDEGITD